jgi:hypothetical protein
MKYFVYLIGGIVLAASLLAAGGRVSVAHASVAEKLGDGVKNVAGEYAADNTEKNLEVVVGNIINVALSITGSLLVIYLIYAGFLWMTAEGDTKKVDKAREIIKQSLIGLVIIVAAYAISNYVVLKLAGTIGNPTS